MVYEVVQVGLAIIALISFSVAFLSALSREVLAFKNSSVEGEHMVNAPRERIASATLRTTLFS